jgi:hypothetical protein
VSVRGRNRRVTETKHALKTTEFWAALAAVAGIVVSAAVISAGRHHGDTFVAHQAWLYVAIVVAGYCIARGLAKSGTPEPYWADQDRDSIDGAGRS